MGYGISAAEAEQFQLSVEKGKAEFKKDPAKARDFLISARIYQLNETTGKLELVPELRSH